MKENILLSQWNDAENVTLAKTRLNPQVKEQWQKTGYVTRAVLVLCAIIFLGQMLMPENIFSALHYYQVFDFTAVMVQPWRLFSPAFMHGGWVHLGFNIVLWWLMAARIEHVKGSLELAVLVMLSALVVNFCQYMVSGFLFLGLSGVVFAVAGYSLSYGYFNGGQLELERSVMFMLAISLIVGVFFAEAMNIGHAAHVSGVIFGLLWGTLKSKI